MNSVRGGAYTQGAVLSDEERERVSALVLGSIVDFAIRSLAGAQLVARVADGLVRLDRIDKLRDRVLGEVLEARLATSTPQKRLEHEREVIAAVSAMVQVARGIERAVAREDVDKLLPALRRLAEVVATCELPVSAAGALGKAAEALASEDIHDVMPDAFVALARAGEQAVSALEARVHDLVAAVEREREHQGELLVLADDRRLRELDRVRTRVVKEIDTLVRTIASVKDLEAKTSSGEAEIPPVPLVLDFKAVGGARPR